MIDFARVGRRHKLLVSVIFLSRSAQKPSPALGVPPLFAAGKESGVSYRHWSWGGQLLTNEPYRIVDRLREVRRVVVM